MGGLPLLNVLVACEFSGAVRDAFCRIGHNAISCDLPDVRPEGEYASRHLVGDCREFLEQPPRGVIRWDILIAFPPCTFLCNSGVQHLYNADKTVNRERVSEMLEAIEFFNYLLTADVKRICVENPIMHGHAAKKIKYPYDQMIHPWQFGHGEVKRTCLWLKNLPRLRPTKIVEGRVSRIHNLGTFKVKENRGRARSKLLPGIAGAMALQWGNESVYERCLIQ